MDIGGQKIFKKYLSNYFENIDGIIFVVDFSDNRSIKSYINEILELDVPIALFYNKIDILENEKIDILENEKNIYNNLINYKIFKVSALKEIGIHEGLNWIVKESSNKIF